MNPDPEPDPTLAELASMFGIAREFWDWKGRRTQVSDATIRACLAALDIDASTPEATEAALAEQRLKPWRRSLPPCVVTVESQPAFVNVHVPAGHPAEVWIRLEDGGSAHTEQVTNDLPDRVVDDAWVGEATFRLPPNLPLGYHRLVLRCDDREVESTLIVTPAFLGFPDAMRGRRVWGYSAQLYSIRSEGSWGIGDLTDLADLAVWSSTHQFAGYVLINPLHAAEPEPPMEPSPYLPTSRLYVNPMYIRPEAVPEYAPLKKHKRDRIARLREELLERIAGSTSIHRDEAWLAKRKALEIIYAAGLRPARDMAFEEFIRREGRSLRDFATWCTLYEVHGRDWRTWPAELQRPASPEVAAFLRANSDRVRFYMWLQWVAEQQLSSTQGTARDAGMPVGIVGDLAVGVSAAGADAWMLRTTFAEGVHVGAPPDAFNQTGQDWCQPPWRPDRLANLAYAPFRAMVQGALRHAGGLRIDHVIGLFRLWWVPRGSLPTDGTYVRYDHEAMVGILALEAKRAGALVVGEDLGTVEPWVRDYLSQRGILGTSVLWFEQEPDGSPHPPECWREYCLASVTTHDLPPTAGYLALDHVRLRAELGLLTVDLKEERATAQAEIQRFIDFLVARGLLAEGETDTEKIVLALHRLLLASPSKVLCAALTDAVGDRLTQNQPGTIDEYPNWRVPLSDEAGRPLLLEQVFQSKRAARLAAVMNGLDKLPAR